MPQRLRTDFSGEGKWRKVADALNAIGRILNNLVGFDGIDIDEVGDETRFYFRGDAGGLNLSRFAFGWKRTEGQAVRIAAGFIEGRYGYHQVSEAVVNVGGNASAKHLIIVTGTDQGGVIEVDSVPESTYAGDSADRWKRVLYRVYLSNNRPVLDLVGSGVGGVVL